MANSTEIGLLTYLDFGSSDRLADWPYMRFRDDYYVLNFLPVDESPLREVVFSVCLSRKLILVALLPNQKMLA